MSSRRKTAGASVTTPAPVALTATYTVIEIATIPDECFLHDVVGAFDTLDPAATQVTWKVSRDADGDFGYTDEVTEDIVLGETDPTNGGARSRFEDEYALDPINGVHGCLYLWVKLNAGTGNITPVVTYRDHD